MSRRAGSTLADKNEAAGAADLRAANLIHGDLIGAVLIDAALIDADLRQADLRGAVFSSAILRGADLCGADLSKARGLTQSQINEARGDEGTKLPDGTPSPGALARRRVRTND